MTYLSLVGVVVINGISQDSHHLTLSLYIRLGETDRKLDAGRVFHSLSFCSQTRKQKSLIFFSFFPLFLVSIVQCTTPPRVSWNCSSNSKMTSYSLIPVRVMHCKFYLFVFVCENTKLKCNWKITAARHLFIYLVDLKLGLPPAAPLLCPDGKPVSPWGPSMIDADWSNHPTDRPPHQ